ncbi:hypothetical protein DAI22_11g044050 [Oryza sativa Japonica Group]|nr:hypothetical protein DAI22_11g044050 [Oryza sativa Japonica Group]
MCACGCWPPPSTPPTSTASRASTPFALPSPPSLQATRGSARSTPSTPPSIPRSSPPATGSSLPRSDVPPQYAATITLNPLTAPRMLQDSTLPWRSIRSARRRHGSRGHGRRHNRTTRGLAASACYAGGGGEGEQEDKAEMATTRLSLELGKVGIQSSSPCSSSSSADHPAIQPAAAATANKIPTRHMLLSWRPMTSVVAVSWFTVANTVSPTSPFLTTISTFACIPFHN